MKNLTFSDFLIEKSRIYIMLISVIIMCRLMYQLLNIFKNHNSAYSNNFIFKLILWFFTPLTDINIFVGISIIIVPLTILLSFEYMGRKLNGE